MRPRDFLSPTTPELQIRIVERAHDDIGEGENIGPDGKGTNRSAYVDRVNQRFGSPLGSYWCANAVAGWWSDAGAQLPPNPGICESWRVVGVPDEPLPGSAAAGLRRPLRHVGEGVITSASSRARARSDGDSGGA
jgi:hypothetical protein